MAISYDRKENGDEIVITLKYQAAVYILLLGCFVLAYPGPYIGIDESTGMLIILGSVAIITAHSVTQIGINREVRKAMKSSSVQVSGSKLSFSNPLTYRIKK